MVVGCVARKLLWGWRALNDLVARPEARKGAAEGMVYLGKNEIL
jgi:hypothetical protein